MELEESTFLTSDYSTKLQSSKQYDTGTKTEIWKEIASPEINPCTYGYLIFDKKRQEYTMGQRWPLQEVVLGKLDSYMQKNEIRTLPNVIHKD